MRTALFLLALGGLLAGCGGGSSNRAPIAPVNAAPTVAAISDITVLGNGSDSIAFAIDDDTTAAANLTVVATSDAEQLLPQTGLALSGTGTSRTLDLAPALDELGSAGVTVTVTDAEGLSASASFIVSVIARDVPIAQFTRDLFAVDRDAEPTLVNALMLGNDAQNDGFEDLLASP